MTYSKNNRNANNNIANTKKFYKLKLYKYATEPLLLFTPYNG